MMPPRPIAEPVRRRAWTVSLLLLSLAACGVGETTSPVAPAPPRSTPPPSAPPPAAAAPRFVLEVNGQETGTAGLTHLGAPSTRSVLVAPALVQGATRLLATGVTVTANDTTSLHVVAEDGRFRLTARRPGRATLTFVVPSPAGATDPLVSSLTVTVAPLTAALEYAAPPALGDSGRATLRLRDPNLAGETPLPAGLAVALVGPDTLPLTPDRAGDVARLAWRPLRVGTWEVRPTLEGEVLPVSTGGSFRIEAVPYAVGVAWDHRPGRDANGVALTIGEETGLNRAAMSADTALTFREVTSGPIGAGARILGRFDRGALHIVRDLIEVAPGRYRVTGLDPAIDVRTSYRTQDTTIRVEWIAVEPSDFRVEVRYGAANDATRPNHFGTLDTDAQARMRAAFDSAARRWSQVLKGRRSAARMVASIEPVTASFSAECAVGPQYDPRRVFRVVATTHDLLGVSGLGGACNTPSWGTPDTIPNPFGGPPRVVRGPNVSGLARLSHSELVNDRFSAATLYALAMHEIGHGLGIVPPPILPETHRWLPSDPVREAFPEQSQRPAGPALGWWHTPALEAFLRQLGRPEPTSGPFWHLIFSNFGASFGGRPTYRGHWWFEAPDIMTSLAYPISGISALHLEESADFIVDWRSVAHPIPAGKVSAVLPTPSTTAGSATRHFAHDAPHAAPWDVRPDAFCGAGEASFDAGADLVGPRRDRLR